MSATLNADDYAVLEKMQAMTPGDLANHPHIPSSLFIYGLVSRQPAGHLIVTKAGHRLLFQRLCYTKLATITPDGACLTDDSAGKWLLSSGFIALHHEDGTCRISKRGRVWLESFQADNAMPAAEIVAEDFARRRAGRAL